MVRLTHQALTVIERILFELDWDDDGKIKFRDFKQSKLFATKTRLPLGLLRKTFAHIENLQTHLRSIPNLLNSAIYHSTKLTAMGVIGYLLMHRTA